MRRYQEQRTRAGDVLGQGLGVRLQSDEKLIRTPETARAVNPASPSRLIALRLTSKSAILRLIRIDETRRKGPIDLLLTAP